MSITLLSQPTNLGVLSTPFKFTFVMSGTNANGVIKRFGYQLLKEDNTPITDILSYAPNDGDSFDLDFSLDIKNYLTTNPPRTNESVLSETRAEMMLKVKLKYWEFVFQDCNNNIANEVTTTVYTIINSVNQYWGYSDINGNILCTVKDKVLTLCKHQFDLFYFYGSGDIELKVYDYQNANPLITKTVTNNNDVLDFMISTDELIQEIQGVIASNPPFVVPTYNSVFDSISKMELSIGGILITTYYLKCSCSSKVLWFQESAGGFTSINLEVQELGVTTTQNEVCEYQESASPYTESIRVLGGKSIFNKKSSKEYILIKNIDKDDIDSIRFYEDLLSSEKYFLEFTARTGFNNNIYRQLIKFIPTQGYIKTFKDDEFIQIIIKGKVNQNHKLPS